MAKNLIAGINFGSSLGFAQKDAKWQPKAPTFKMETSAEPKGNDRNGPCPCGSGMKAKKCNQCRTRGVIPPVHTLGDVEYYNRVEAILMERHGNTDHITGRLTSHVRSYWNDGVITPERCCDLLEVLTRFEREDEARRQAGNYPGLASD